MLQPVRWAKDTVHTSRNVFVAHSITVLVVAARPFRHNPELRRTAPAKSRRVALLPQCWFTCFRGIVLPETISVDRRHFIYIRISYIYHYELIILINILVYK